MPVKVTGAIALRKALLQYSPDLAKATTKEISNSLKPVVRKARGYLPSNSDILSNWRASKAVNKDWRFPTYDYTLAKRGVTYKATPSKMNSRGFKSLASIFNKTAAGAIYETAGTKTPNSVFVQNLNAKTLGRISGDGKKQGRVIFRAWEEDQGKAQDGVLRAIEKASKLFKERTIV